MSKLVKYTIVILAAIFVSWLSLDIQNLQAYKDSIKPVSFNATNYAEKFWSDSLPESIADAPFVADLLQLLSENPKDAFEKYGRKLGISKSYYFMLKGNGEIVEVDDEYLVLALDGQTHVKILTDFIYGNALRDGSGKVNIDNFVNMTDFNAVSVAINKLVKEKVAARLIKSAKPEQQLEFTGAMELNEENFDLAKISIIPVSVKLTNGK